MTSQKSKKCAHITCLCDVKEGEEYCGNVCRARGPDNVEIACGCDHLACPYVVALATIVRRHSHQEN